MSVSRPPQLRPGDEVRFRGALATVTAMSGAQVELADVTGARSVLAHGELFCDPGFELVTPTRRRAPLPARGSLEGLPTEVVDKALWWEAHLLEVITGAGPDASPGAAPAPAYDPLRRSLRAREVDKVAELQAAGHPVALSTLQRMRHSYQSEGLLGLVDGRFTRPGGNGVDERVSAAIEKAIAAETDRSTGTITRLRRRVETILRTDYSLDPASVMPPRTTFYRLVERISAGRHTFGSAPTRRSLAQRPDGPFGFVTALRPGEWMQVDSTPLEGLSS